MRVPAREVTEGLRPHLRFIVDAALLRGIPPHEVMKLESPVAGVFHQMGLGQPVQRTLGGADWGHDERGGRSRGYVRSRMQSESAEDHLVLVPQALVGPIE